MDEKLSKMMDLFLKESTSESILKDCEEFGCEVVDLPPKRTLDLDRLHKVHFGEITGRRSGQTTLFATTLIGVAQLNNDKGKILVACTNQQRANHTMGVLMSTCQMLGVKFKKLKQFEVKVENTTFLFTSNIEEKILSQYMYFTEDVYFD